MTLHTLTAYYTSADRLICGDCYATVPADDVESAPAGCDVGPSCGDCMTVHVRGCAACSAAVADGGDL